MLALVGCPLQGFSTGDEAGTHLARDMGQKEERVADGSAPSVLWG